MSKKREHILLKVNAVLVGLIGMLGLNSCSTAMVKYGVPDYIIRDSLGIDTMAHCMYGVTPYYPIENQLNAPAEDDNKDE